MSDRVSEHSQYSEQEKDSACNSFIQRINDWIPIPGGFEDIREEYTQLLQKCGYEYIEKYMKDHSVIETTRNIVLILQKEKENITLPEEEIE